MLGIPGTNDQGNGDFDFRTGTRAIPQFNTGFSAVGNRDGWNPIFRDERTYSLVDEPHEDEGTPRLPRRYT